MKKLRDEPTECIVQIKISTYIVETQRVVLRKECYADLDTSIEEVIQDLLAALSAEDRSRKLAEGSPSY